jgi:hypothetical protein
MTRITVGSFVRQSPAVLFTALLTLILTTAPTPASAQATWEQQPGIGSYCLHSGQNGFIRLTLPPFGQHYAIALRLRLLLIPPRGRTSMTGNTAANLTDIS